ncbi:hypothetical protein SAMD00019534_031390 [Acytostelium subglobosum LB1]|uniref:hypothetical protein n=1 Tax=Acytostelium subglobosum LB1 TaxID=1410327 RepID=UPI000644D937|nr:hypothetical protein SAMD00019534_031390 [Acytostelium subglobosum LB1]GAM19964.1 hypothetical protein SAMD00019534_031390 [Acytostelium subglobosum LB1]|eukprot:XP_012756726.1 hypothetical protein SAMD00019534_031390 [Acytostelium subglobosum LB1]
MNGLNRINKYVNKGYGPGLNIWVKDNPGLLPDMFRFYNFPYSNEAEFIQLVASSDFSGGGYINMRTMVAIMNVGAMPTLPSPALCQAFATLGSSQIYEAGASGATNYCMIGYKGQAPGSALETFGDGSTGAVNLTSMLNSYHECTRVLGFSYNETTLDIMLGHLPLIPYFVNPLEDGVNVVTLNSQVNTRLNQQVITNFPTMNDDPNVSKALAQFIDSIAKGTFIMIIARGLNLSKNSLNSDAIQSLQRFGSKCILNFIQNDTNDCWFMLLKMGTPSIYTEMAFNHSSPCTASIHYNLINNELITQNKTVSDDDINIYVATSNPIYAPVGIQNFIVSVGGLPVTFQSNAGLLMCAISEVDGKVYFARNYDVSSASVKSTLQMIADIMSITAGTLVVICTGALSQDFAISDNLAFAMTTCGSKVTVNPITSTSSFALIGRKGAPSGSVPEILSLTGPVTLLSNFKRQFKPVKPFVHIKAASNATPSVPPEPYILINGLPVSGTFGPGLNVVAINPTNSTVIMSNNYDTTDAASQPRPSSKFTTDITALPQGTIVALSTLGSAGTYLGTARDTITNLVPS